MKKGEQQLERKSGHFSFVIVRSLKHSLHSFRKTQGHGVYLGLTALILF